jgi:hypothetical protein
VIVNVLKAPFRAIGGLFTSGDKIEELRIDPITFAAGDPALSPEMERQTVRVADFLRRSPYVGLTLTSVTTPEDVEALKAREVTAKLDFFQKEKKIADRARAIHRYYEANFKDVPVPPTEAEQLAWLRQREPAPIGPVEDLRKRRLEVTRDRLAKVEGIPEARLQTQAPGAPSPADAPPTGGASTSSAPPAPAAPGSAPSPSAAPAPAPPSASGPGPAPGNAVGPGAVASSGASPAAGSTSPGESASGATAGADAPSKPASGDGGRVEFGIVGESD